MRSSFRSETKDVAGQLGALVGATHCELAVHRVCQGLSANRRHRLSLEIATVEQERRSHYGEWVGGLSPGSVKADVKEQVPGYLLRRKYKEGFLRFKGKGKTPLWKSILVISRPRLDQGKGGGQLGSGASTG